MTELAVVVPCHNEAATLAHQLSALVSQDWDEQWEIIVVDNNSSDDTALIALDYCHGEVPVRVIRADERAGVAYARNTGVRATEARSVAFCDGDDIVYPGWVEAIGEALRETPLVTGPVDSSLLNDGWLATTRPMGSAHRPPHFGNVPFARGNNTAMHRAVWDELGGYDENFVGLEDIEFSLRAASAGYRPKLIPAALVAYRFRSGLHATWRQGLFYGLGRPELAAQAAALGLQGPKRFDGLKSWAWLVFRSPALFNKSGRYAWTFTLANRLGVLLGAIKQRRLFI